jgi:hypothetical protein
MEPGLMDGKRHVLAKLPQELALAAAEAVGFAARCQENAEDVAFYEQWSRD